MSKRLVFMSILISLGMAVTAAWGADAAPTVDQVLQGIESRYEGKGFSANFFQESMLEAMQISDTAEGRLIVERPGKMRWEYTLPDPQLIITDGQSLWIYRPADNQVMVGQAPDFFAQGKGAAFLSDIRLIRKSYTVALKPAENNAYYRLELTPKKPTAEIADILLSVAKGSYQVDQVITHNAYGDETRIVLNDYKFDIDPKDDLFTFDIPEGTDVIQMEKP